MMKGFRRSLVGRVPSRGVPVEFSNRRSETSFPQVSTSVHKLLQDFWCKRSGPPLSDDFALHDFACFCELCVLLRQFRIWVAALPRCDFGLGTLDFGLVQDPQR